MSFNKINMEHLYKEAMSEKETIFDLLFFNFDDVAKL